MIEFVMGYLTAALAGLGIGGGGLLVIYLALIEKLPQLKAQGINLLFFIFSSAAAMAVHIFKRRIPLKLTLILATSGVAGACVGNMITGKIGENLLRIMFGILLVISGIIALSR